MNRFAVCAATLALLAAAAEKQPVLRLIDERLWMRQGRRSRADGMTRDRQTATSAAQSPTELASTETHPETGNWAACHGELEATLTASRTRGPFSTSGWTE